VSINIQLKQNQLIHFNFRFPLPQISIDYLNFTYEMAKEGKVLFLTVKITYDLEDFDTKDKYEVTTFSSVYEITPENESLTAARIYPICETTTDTLNACLDFLVQCKEVPPKTVSCPPICHLHAGLQEVVAWYDAH
jgi:hypothetical protein